MCSSPQEIDRYAWYISLLEGSYIHFIVRVRLLHKSLTNGNDNNVYICPSSYRGYVIIYRSSDDDDGSEAWLDLITMSLACLVYTVKT